MGVEVDRVAVDVAEQEVGDLGEPRFGVAHGRRRIGVHRAEIALAVDQRHAHRPALGHPRERVVDRAVAVRVIFTHDVADDAARLAVRPSGDIAGFLAGVEDAAVDRLQAVAHVGQRAADDHAHRVIEVAGLHLLDDRDRRDVAVARRRRECVVVERAAGWPRKGPAVRGAQGDCGECRAPAILSRASRGASATPRACAHERARVHAREDFTVQNGFRANGVMALGAPGLPRLRRRATHSAHPLPKQETQSMKLTTTAMALALAASAAPAAAQYDRPPPPPPMRFPTTSRPRPATRSRPAKRRPKDGNAHPSGKALKAIVDLQKAVNANDTANIPAKVAAAQAVASTKDDRYIIAPAAAQGGGRRRMTMPRRRARSTRSPARASSIRPRSPSSTSRLAASFTTRRNSTARRAPSSRHRRSIRRTARRSSTSAESRFSQGRKADAVAAVPARHPGAHRGRPEARGSALQAGRRHRLRAQDAGRDRPRPAVDRGLSERRPAGATRSPSTAT